MPEEKIVLTLEDILKQTHKFFPVARELALQEKRAEIEKANGEVDEESTEAKAKANNFDPALKHSLTTY